MEDEIKQKVSNLKLEKEKNGVYIYNLGTGVGYSVLDVVKTFDLNSLFSGLSY